LRGGVKEASVGLRDLDPQALSASLPHVYGAQLAALDCCNTV
jgi:hypothetical protein